jgi:hypothetical protein
MKRLSKGFSAAPRDFAEGLQAYTAHSATIASSSDEDEWGL